jgi:hypothetical protein
MRLLSLTLHLTTSKNSSLPNSKNNLASSKAMVEEAGKRVKSTTRPEVNSMGVGVEGEEVKLKAIREVRRQAAISLPL